MNDDYDNYLYASVDGGQTSARSATACPGQVVMTVAEDPKNPAVLYAGTEFGLFVSTDRGGTGTRRSGLPTVPIHEIVFHPRENDMILATHGRSIWILDDATPIQQSAEAMAPSVPLRLRRPAMQFNPANDRGFVTDAPFRGKNPTFGVPISYYLKGDVPSANVALRISDAAGNRGAHAQRGTTCAMRPRPASIACYWDFRYQPLPAPAAAAGRWRWRGGGFGGGGGNNGRSSCPVTTASRCVVNGKDIATKPLRVAGDTADPAGPMPIARRGTTPRWRSIACKSTPTSRRTR